MIGYEGSVDGFLWSPALSAKANYLRLVKQTEWGESYFYFNCYTFFLVEKWRRVAERVASPSSL